MKPLSDLGISPTPWKADGNNVSCKEWDSSHGMSFDHTVADCYRHANARIIAESPNLYRDLYDAVYERCSQCEDTNIEQCRGKCFVAKWRDTLARASGEEVAK